MGKVVILSGVSGSGKSTYANKLLDECEDKMRACSMSADTYFIDNGEYKFAASMLGHAHAACFHDFITTLRDKQYELIVVDNTNTTLEEIAPYILGASAYCFSHEVVRFWPNSPVDDDLKACAARNAHNVSLKMVMVQYKRMCASSQNWPKHWNVRNEKVAR